MAHEAAVAIRRSSDVMKKHKDITFDEVSLGAWHLHYLLAQVALLTKNSLGRIGVELVMS